MHTIETKDFGLSLIKGLVVDHTSLKKNAMDEEKYHTDLSISNSGNNNNNLLETSAQINILMVVVAHSCESM